MLKREGKLKKRTKLSEPAADKHKQRVEKIHHRRQHRADQISGVLDDAVGCRITVMAGLRDILRADAAFISQARRQPQAFTSGGSLHSHRDDGRACRHDFPTAQISAVAAPPRSVCANLTHVPG